MKNSSLLFGLVSMLLTAGCSKPEDKSASQPDRTARPQLPKLDHSLDAGGVPPPPGQSIPMGTGLAIEPTAPTAVLLVRDSQQANELADYSEKVFTRWNEALKQFRAKQNRLPGTLAELEKFQPKLASLSAPKGFQLDFDRQLGEINVVRTTPSKPAR